VNLFHFKTEKGVSFSGLKAMTTKKHKETFQVSSEMSTDDRLTLNLIKLIILNQFPGEEKNKNKNI